MSPPRLAVLRQPEEIRALTRRLKAAGERVVFVPTMGDLHDGHLSLVATGARLGRVVVSIFVNPAQFGPGEDFESYPRDLERDLARLAELGVTAVVAPDPETVYSPEATTWVEVEGLTDALCGLHRPGHFRGVTTVVAKLFGLVQPDVAVFGQKDAQQCLVLRRMVLDLCWPVHLVFVPTVREADGLAMSSRNRYLDEAQRAAARSVSGALEAARDRLESGERDVTGLERIMRERIQAEAIDYAEVRSLPDLSHPTHARGRVLLAVAAHVGRARLIDNLCLQVDEDAVTLAPLVDEATEDAVRRALSAPGNQKSSEETSLNDRFAVVLAAGKGTRMKSDLAKVLHELDGQPLLSHVLRELNPLEASPTVVIVGHQADQVEALCDGFGVDTALQAEQLGTGHAVQQAEPKLAERSGYTVILCGDVPLLQTATIQRLVDSTKAAGAAGAVLTAIAEDPTGYGRILRGDREDELVGIVEHKDATEEQRQIREYNTGTYCFDNELLWSALAKVGSDNSQGEFYLTDVVEILVESGKKVVGVVCPDEREVQGINTIEDLRRASRDLEAMRDG